MCVVSIENSKIFFENNDQFSYNDNHESLVKDRIDLLIVLLLMLDPLEDTLKRS